MSKCGFPVKGKMLFDIWKSAYSTNIQQVQDKFIIFFIHHINGCLSFFVTNFRAQCKKFYLCEKGTKILSITLKTEHCTHMYVFLIFWRVPSWAMFRFFSEPRLSFFGGRESVETFKTSRLTVLFRGAKKLFWFTVSLKNKRST